jgi:hypothetical protein
VLGLTAQAGKSAHAPSDDGRYHGADHAAFDQVLHGSISFHAVNIEMRAQSFRKYRSRKRKDAVKTSD